MQSAAEVPACHAVRLLGMLEGRQAFSCALVPRAVLHTWPISSADDRRLKLQKKQKTSLLCPLSDDAPYCQRSEDRRCGAGRVWKLRVGSWRLLPVQRG